MTVSEVRCALSSIVQPIFTDDFARKYEMIAGQMHPDSITSTVAFYAGDVDSYIALADFLRDRKEELSFLAKVSNPLVVFSLFYRYHMITQALKSMRQDAPFTKVPTDGSLLSALLVDWWNVILGDGINVDVHGEG